MKTIIAGSRDISLPSFVESAVAASQFTITEVVSGCARGVDTLAIQFAAKNGLPVKRFPANWDKFGRGAGYRRNAEMAQYAEALIAVWDGKSRGTGHMINIAQSKHLKVFVYRTDGAQGMI